MLGDPIDGAVTMVQAQSNMQHRLSEPVREHPQLDVITEQTGGVPGLEGLEHRLLGRRGCPARQSDQLVASA